MLVRPGRERLTGTVEVDGTFIGGEEPGLRGGRARGKKVLTGIAVEVRPRPKGIGRCRMAPLDDASADSLRSFLTDHVEPGTTVITDGWSGYKGIDKLGSGPLATSTSHATNVLPGPAARIPASCCRWSIGLRRW